MHSFFFAFSGCRIIEIFFFTFLFFILCIASLLSRLEIIGPEKARI